jgi:GDP/UDP-N,N'-diacetylbacillosamine 2-epimerase (hydrolysing)
MNAPKRIVVITGIRSEYDILYSVLRAIHAHDGLELHLVVTGAHLAPQFGYTVAQIEADGFPVAERIESLLDSNSAGSRIRSAAIQQLGLVQALERIRPDMMLVCGDREESITCALAGAYMNIPVAHLAGGDIVVGNVDDSVRHAVTKLAHIHFPFSEESAVRIRRMGEEPWRIHMTGNPGLDRFRLFPSLSRAELSRTLRIELDDTPLILLIQHNISSEIGDAARQMEITLQAIETLGYTTLVGYPNSDAGSRDIIAVIEHYRKRLNNLCVYRNLPRNEFLSVLKTADVLVGNSSLGILEAPFLKLPAVNVGNRQKKRQHADNVLFVPHDRNAIVQAVKTALHNNVFRERLQTCKCPFGDGYAGTKIADTIHAMKIDRKLLVKDWTY